MVKIDDTNNFIIINGSLTAENVSEIQDHLSLCIPGRDDVKIELTELERIDAAGAYMLLIIKLKSLGFGQKIKFMVRNPLIKKSIDQHVPHLLS